MLLVLGLLTGCATYNTQRDPGRNIAGVQRFFVVGNDNDNHALDRLIVTALTARGFTAHHGPLTMMPEETQAVISYQDYWTWDFGDHLVYLQISVRDRKSIQPYTTVKFSTKVPTRTPVSGIVEELVGRLF